MCPGERSLRLAGRRHQDGLNYRSALRLPAQIRSFRSVSGWDTVRAMNQRDVQADEGTRIVEAVKPRDLVLNEIREALAPAVEAIQEVRDEVADRLRTVDAAQWLTGAIEALEPLQSDNDLGRLVHAALVGLRAGVEWVTGERDVQFFAAIVDVVAFGMQVREYIDRGHYLDDLKRAGEQLVFVWAKTNLAGAGEQR